MSETTEEGGFEAPAVDPTSLDPTPDGNDGANGEGVAETHTSKSDSDDSPRYTVKVDGQELDVTYDELINGYQRQADYTRKTQALSARSQELDQQQALWDRFEEDPEGTITALADAFGLKVAQEMVEDAADAADDSKPQHGTDPRVDELENWYREQQEADLIEQVEDELDSLSESHGEFDREALLQFAVESDIVDLEAALLKMQRHQSHEGEVRERNEAALAAKRGAPPIASGSRAAGSTESGADTAPSMAEALREAMREHGVDSLAELH